jgi:hypothetical protein
MDALSNIALATGLSWASGLRLYATVFVIGLLARYGYVTLPESLGMLTHPLVIGVSGVLLFGGWLALAHPALFLVFIVLFVLLLVWLLPKVWRGVRRVFGGGVKRPR